VVEPHFLVAVVIIIIITFIGNFHHNIHCDDFSRKCNQW
jgi:hypothetical protein